MIGMCSIHAQTANEKVKGRSGQRFLRVSDGDLDRHDVRHSPRLSLLLALALQGEGVHRECNYFQETRDPPQNQTAETNLYRTQIICIGLKKSPCVG